MQNLIIENDEGIKKEYNLINYRLKDKENGIKLELITTTDNLSYLIKNDGRANFLSIKEFLENKVEKVIRAQEILKIREYLDRDYIFINDEETERQFTAFKE